jgi:hypothetical protein
MRYYLIGTLDEEGMWTGYSRDSYESALALYREMQKRLDTNMVEGVKMYKCDFDVATMDSSIVLMQEDMPERKKIVEYNKPVKIEQALFDYSVPEDQSNDY